MNEAGGGFAPVWLPTKPKLTELPPLAARSAFQLTGVTVTCWPAEAKVAFQVLPETDSVSAGKVNARVHPVIGFGPVLVTLILATKP